MLLPTSSFTFAVEVGFLEGVLSSVVASSVPVNSFCFATSCKEVGFFGEMEPSTPKEI